MTVRLRETVSVEAFHAMAGELARRAGTAIREQVTVVELAAKVGDDIDADGYPTRDHR
ncbi:hypothetical protein [Amycolatopsis sp. NPDC059657]|uniref:hypothetical protein n=1 Tax=Amycolatopsis sp. NPDC059657 TaxID=3346899 RepID=UPI00366E6598